MFAFSFMVKEFYLPKYIKNKLPLCPHGFLFIFEFHFIRRTWNRFTTLERSRIQNGGGRRTLPCTGNFNKLYPTHLKKTLLKYVCIKWITFSISIIKIRSFLKNVEGPISPLVIWINYPLPCSVNGIHLPSEGMQRRRFWEEKYLNDSCKKRKQIAQLCW